MIGTEQSAIDNRPTGYEPTHDEEKSLKLVDRLFSKSKKAKSVYDEKWPDYYRMFRGKQWKEQRPSYRHSESINLIFRAIQSEVPMLTDALPKPEFIPTEPNDYELAQILNDVLDSDWTSKNWAYAFTESLYEAHFYGTGFGSVTFDHECSDGLGEIKFTSSDPFYQFPDPYATDVNENSEYHIEAEPVSVGRVRAEYPDKAQFIKGDVVDITKKDKNVSEVMRYISPTDSRSSGGSNPYDLDTRDEVLKITCYLRDTEILEEEVKETGSDGIEKQMYVQKLKYPKIRKLIVVNGVLCEDTEIEYEDNKFPFIRLTNYILPREFWGISEIEQLESPQKIFNKLISFTLDVLTLMGNPIWICDTTSGVDTDNLYNRPGLVVEKEPGSEVRREDGVQLQPYVLQIIDRMKGYFDDISGSNDVSRGVKPEGVTAASAIEALQTAQQTRVRQKTKYIDAFMQNFGQMYLSRVFQFYSVPRIFRITNNENATNYFKFHVDNTVDEQGKPVKVAKVRKYHKGTDDKYYEGEQAQHDIRRKFDVKITTGSALPFEKQRVEQQTFNLFDRQIIDAEEVLKNLRYPNAESLMKRMNEKAMQAQQAQAQAQAPQQQAQPTQ